MLIKKLKDSIEKGSAESTVPQELLEVFNNELPNGIRYECIDSKHLAIELNKTENTVTVYPSENKAFFDKYNSYFKSKDDILKIARMTQTPLIVHNKKTVYNGKEIEQKYVFRNVFNDDVVVPTGVLNSPALPTIHLKLSDKYDTSIFTEVHLQMQRCDNIERCVYSNSDQNEVMCVNMETDTEYANVELYSYNLNMYIDNKKAKKVKDVITAYKLYEALINNRLLINGVPFDYKHDISNDKMDGVQLGLELYEKLYSLEKEMNINFDPSVDTELEDLYYVNGLYSSIIKGKPFIDNSVLGSVTVTKEDNKDIIRKAEQNNTFVFVLSGNLKLTIFGQDITVYYIKIANNLKIKKYKPVNNKNIRLLFEDNNDKQETVCMLYKTEQELNDVMSRDNYIEEILNY